MSPLAILGIWFGAGVVVAVIWSAIRRAERRKGGAR